MTTSDFLYMVLIAAIITSIISYFVAAASSAKAELNSRSGVRVLRYVRFYRAVGVLALFEAVLCLGFLASTLTDAEARPSQKIVACIFLVAFSAMGFYTFAGLFLTHIIFTDDAVTSVSPWTRRLTFKWDEIDYVTHSSTSKCYIIGGKGKKIRASQYLVGVYGLIGKIRQRVPEEMWMVGREDQSLFIGDGKP